MKKFILGLTCGIVLMASTAVYASNTIQAYLFSAKFVINGQDKTPPGDQVLNYNGSVYVPVRYVAENLGETVAYDDVSKTITIDNGFDIVDANNLYSRAGHVTVTKEGTKSKISGKLYIGYDSWNHKFIDGMMSLEPNVDHSKTSASGNLVFWNDLGKVIEKVPFEISGVSTGKEQIVNFQTESQMDVTKYTLITMEYKTNPGARPNFDAKDPLIQDSTNKVEFGVLNTVKSGDFTVIRALLNTANYSGDIPAGTVTIRFLDADGNTLDTIHTSFAQKTDPMYTILLGKGDLTNYKSVQVELGS